MDFSVEASSSTGEGNGGKTHNFADLESIFLLAAIQYVVVIRLNLAIV